MSKQTIISLALLKAQWEVQRKDYLEIFVPFVVECIRLGDYSVVSLPQLRKDIEWRFGLRIPQHALKLILNRVKAKGFVQAENKMLVPVFRKLSEHGFAVIQQKVIQSHEKVVQSLLEFSHSRFSMDIGPAEAEAALHHFLQSDPLLSIGKLISPDTKSLLPKTGPSVQYIIASFIQEIEATRPTEFDHLETIVKGSMLASALFLPDPARTERKFKNTEIYFDTSFLIFVLGHAGPIRRDPCVELLTLLTDSGARLSCFTHTFDEAWAALRACAFRLERKDVRNAYGPSMEFFLTEGIDADDVEARMARMEEDLRKLRIHIRPSLQGEYEGQVDENTLRSSLQAELPFHSDNALDRDVKSLAGVMRLWKGSEPPYLEDAPALFVTTNSAVARVARELYRHATAGNGDGDVPKSVAPCVTDQNLTTLLWLKKPTQAPELPRKRIIADTMAAMQPSMDLLAKYEAQLELLMRRGDIQPDDYYLMRYSREAKRALMDETVGQEDAFVEGTVSEVIQRARKAMLAEAEVQLTQQKQLREMAERRALEEQRLREEEVSSVTEDARLRDQGRRRRVWQRAQKYAYAVTLLCDIVAFGVLAVGLYSLNQFATASPKLHALKSKPLQIGLIAIQVCVFVLSVLNLHFGVTLNTPIKRLEAYLTKRFERWLLLEG